MIQKNTSPTLPLVSRLLGVFVALLGFVQLSEAHQPGTSSLLLKSETQGSLVGEVHIADVDLASVELMLSNRADSENVDAAELPWLVLKAGGQEIPFTTGTKTRANTDGRIHTMIPFTAEIGGAEYLEVEYVNYFAFDPQHKVVTSLEAGGTTRVGMLAYETPAWRTSVIEPGPASQFVKFTWEGVWHIWIGIDHILFLLALLLPSVLIFRDGRWKPVNGFREALINVLKVVTAFTVAHSITLTLAALHIFMLPAKFVESVIAISVLMAAMNNIWPVVKDRTWMVAFAFGLIHGFGFANVLADLSLPTGTLAIALVSFNIGVELGQLAIVSVFFPIAFLLRAHVLYQPVKLRLGSALIGVIAVGWIVQRVFEVELMPF